MQYRKEIDGLRAVAVIPVIFFHAAIGPFHGGFIGVDIFFVISGYLITTILLSDLSAGNYSILEFYERRIRRILPALFFVLAVSLPFAWFWLLPRELEDFSQSIAAVTLFASNILFWQKSGYFDSASELKPLLHTWSLAVEEQYYVLFPILLAVIWKHFRSEAKKILFALFIGSIAFAQWAQASHPTANFYLLPTRGWELLIGSLTAVFLLENERPVDNRLAVELLAAAGLLLIVIAIFVFNEQTPTPSVITLIPTVGTALIILFARQDTLTGKILGYRLLVAIGLVSYSAYLWHQPLFAFARIRSLTPLTSELFLVLIFVCFGLAFFSWRFVERPFRKRSPLSRFYVFSIAALGTLFFLLIGSIGHITNGTFGRSPDSTMLAIQSSGNSKDTNKRCWSELTRSENLDSACILGKVGIPPAFVVFGDSHAGSLISEINRQALKHGTSGLDYTYNSCSPIIGGTDKFEENQSKICANLREQFFNRLHGNKIPQTVILLSRWTLRIEQQRFNNQEGGHEAGKIAPWHAPEIDSKGYVAALSDSYRESVEAILASGRTVILIYPIPEMGWDVPARLGRIYMLNGVINPEDASTSVQVFSERNEQAYVALDSIADRSSLIRIKPESIFCNTYIPGRCAAHKDGKALYYDDDHLSNYGAFPIVTQMFAHINPKGIQ
jgi:peptidoglycan/LPS O-acetylase OafA/YrhL